VPIDHPFYFFLFPFSENELFIIISRLSLLSYAEKFFSGKRPFQLHVSLIGGGSYYCFIANNGSWQQSWSGCQWRRNFHSGQGKNTLLPFAYLSCLLRSLSPYSFMVVSALNSGNFQCLILLPILGIILLKTIYGVTCNYSCTYSQ
jgi:hypothetical protein